MCDEHNEPRFGNLFKDLHDLDGVLRVEVARRLVRKDDVCALDERAGDRYPLLLSARKRVALLVLIPPHIHDFKNFFAAALYLRFIVKSGDEHGVAHDFGYGTSSFKIIILKNKPDFGVAYFIYLARDVLAVDINSTAVLPFQPADNVQKRRFAAARLAEDGDKTFFGKVKRYAFQYLIFIARTGIERLFYILYFYLDHYFDPLLRLLRID